MRYFLIFSLLLGLLGGYAQAQDVDSSPARLPKLKPGEAAIDRTNKSGHYTGKVVTEVTPITVFYPAENYHQGYCKLHPNQSYVRQVSLPKVVKLRQVMPGKLKREGSLQL